MSRVLIQPRIWTIESGKKVIIEFIGRNRRTAALKIVYIRIVFIHSVDYKKRISQYSHSRDGVDRLHVLVVGHAGLAVGPVLELEVRLHDCAHGEEGGRLGDAGRGKRLSNSFGLYSQRRL